MMTMKHEYSALRGLTKNDLKQYSWRQKKISKLEQSIKGIRAQLERITSLPLNDADVRKASGFSDRRGDLVAALVDLEGMVYMHHAEAVAAQLRIETTIMRLPEREQLLIRARYIAGDSWEQICVDMHYEWAHIHRIHANALKLLGGQKE
jgi:DNA-directed RNA polymerase specialized sigma subunit